MPHALVELGGLRGILKVTAEACEAAGRESARRRAGRRRNARKYPTVWQRKHRRGCVHTRNKRRLREQRAAFDSLLPSRRGREAAYPLAPLSAPLHKSRKQRAAPLNHLPFSSAAVDARVHPRRPEEPTLQKIPALFIFKLFSSEQANVLARFDIFLDFFWT